MWNWVVSKPENANLKCETAIKIEFQFSLKRKHSFIAGTKLQVAQNKRKTEANFNRPLFI